MDSVEMIYDIVWFSAGIVVIIIAGLMFNMVENHQEVTFELQNSLSNQKTHEMGLIFMRNSHSDGFDSPVSNFRLLSTYYSLDEGEKIELNGREVCRKCESKFNVENVISKDAEDFRTFFKDDPGSGFNARIDNRIYVDGISEEGRREGIGFPVPAIGAAIEHVYVKFRRKESITERTVGTTRGE